jgi:hypothetical protein
MKVYQMSIANVKAPEDQFTGTNISVSDEASNIVKVPGKVGHKNSTAINRRAIFYAPSLRPASCGLAVPVQQGRRVLFQLQPPGSSPLLR